MPEVERTTLLVPFNWPEKGCFLDDYFLLKCEICPTLPINSCLNRAVHSPTHSSISSFMWSLCSTEVQFVLTQKSIWSAVSPAKDQGSLGPYEKCCLLTMWYWPVTQRKHSQSSSAMHTIRSSLTKRFHL